MIACQKGILLCGISSEGQLSIKRAIQEYSSLYAVNLAWAGGSKFVIITTRPRFSNKAQAVPGKENYAIVSYTMYDAEEEDEDQRQVILG